MYENVFLEDSLDERLQILNANFEFYIEKQFKILKFSMKIGLQTLLTQANLERKILGANFFISKSVELQRILNMIFEKCRTPKNSENFFSGKYAIIKINTIKESKSQ